MFQSCELILLLHSSTSLVRLRSIACASSRELFSVCSIEFELGGCYCNASHFDIQVASRAALGDVDEIYKEVVLVDGIVISTIKLYHFSGKFLRSRH